MAIEKILVEKCKENGLDETLIADIVKICDANFYDDSNSQGKRTSQINKLIDDFSKQEFDNQNK